MKIMTQIIGWVGTLAVTLVVTPWPATAAGAALAPDPLRPLTPRLQDGDLIFIREANPIFRHVAETTRSWETHVGILFSGPNGTWQVAESRFPRSQFTPLEKFIARSEHGRFTITRHAVELSPGEKQRLRQSARARMGRFYNLGFNYDARGLYCSKLVFDVYREAAGVQVGSLTTFRQLLVANPRAPVGFWRAWFFGRIPWERRCITTTSEMTSPEFRIVYDSTSEKISP